MQDIPTEGLSGRRLGNFDVGPFIGGGGMGEVYVAYDQSLDRRVAVKVLKRAFAHDENFVKRFQREARAAAKLNHPNIVQVYAVDIASEPPYMVMEYIEGTSLEEVVAANTPVPWQRALEIIEQCSRALAAAHHAGIVHRDIKPGNILLEPNGGVRVTDFGIAKVLGAQTQLTQGAVSVGSPSYMSPEQCGVGAVVPASDLFALGITLFEMLTGRLPFDAETHLGLIKQITSDPLPSLRDSNPQLPGELQVFVEAMTAKDAQHRYPSALMVAEDAAALRSSQAPKHLRLSQATAIAPAAPPAIAPSGQVIAATATAVGTPSLVEDLLDGHPTPRGAGNLYETPRPPIPWGRFIVAGIIATGIAMGGYFVYNRPPGPPPEDLPSRSQDQQAGQLVETTPEPQPGQPIPPNRPRPGQLPGFPAGLPPAPVGYHYGPQGELVPGPPPHHRHGLGPGRQPPPRPAQQ